MKKAVLSNRIFLTKTEELVENLEKNILYKFSIGRPDAPLETVYDVTSITDSVISIPIGRIDLIPKDYKIVDKRIINEVNLPEFSFTLRADQQVIYDEVKGNCIINALPGWGKTFIALSLAKKFSMKTLIIVNTVALRDQWVSEIKKVFNIKAGIIGSGKFDIDSPIVVSNTQTLQKKIHKIVNIFGVVFVDEVHHLPANSFKNIVDKLRAKIKIGLTGTLGRKDGKHVLITDYLSLEIFKPEDRNRMTPNIEVFNSNIPLNAGLHIPWATSINSLTARQDYLDLIVFLAKRAREDGHTVLIVSDRVAFLELCSSYIDNSICLTGPTQGREELVYLINDGTIPIVFASMSIFKEGINIPRLSCLILGTPIGNNDHMLTQLIGRVTRPFEGKLIPLVMDIGLKGNTAHRQLQARINLYINNGYKITYNDIL